jgi:hypothetical protein
MKFVPDELQKETRPAGLSPLNEKGETIDYLDRSGTQLELEEALTGWLRSQITRIDQRLATSTRPLRENTANSPSLHKPRETGHLPVWTWLPPR